MIKRLLFLVAAVLIGSMSALEAKINYVPLYIVDTHADVKAVKRTPAMPLYITQDGHKLILPEVGDSLTLMVLRGDECVFSQPYYGHSTTVYLPAQLVGDYEVRLCGATYYYYGFITLEEAVIPKETGLWENITLLGSNTPQQVILDNIMGLNVVEYNMKSHSPRPSDSDLVFLSEEDKEAYLREWEESQASLRAQRRFGLLPDELRAVFPQVVADLQGGVVGINYIDLIPILISCIQELKVQLDSRTEKMVDIMMSRSTGYTAVNAAREAIGSTLLSVGASSVGEPAQVRYLLASDAADACVVITDMGGRTQKKVPVVPSDTKVSIDGGTLGEGIFLCTLLVDGRNVGTKRLVKTR